MTAMSSANKNAEKLIEYFTAEYNQLRQANITEEITEITAGAKAQILKRKKEVRQDEQRQNRADFRLGY